MLPTGTRQCTPVAEQGPGSVPVALGEVQAWNVLTSLEANARLRLTRDGGVLDRLDFIYEHCRVHGGRSVQLQWYLAQMRIRWAGCSWDVVG